MLSQIVLALVAAGKWCIANQDQLAVIGCFLIPTIITGLSKHPGPATNEVVEGLQMLLARLSLVHHADSPATLKLPFTAPAAPPTGRTVDLDEPAPAAPAKAGGAK